MNHSILPGLQAHFLAGTMEKDQEQRDRDPPAPGAPGYDADMNIAPYREEGYDQSPFGPNLPQPEVVLQKILKMLTIGDVFAC